MSDQRIFADALLTGRPSCPPGLTAWNGSDPERRFAIYRSNVIVSLIDALADTFPVTQQLVGEEFFRAMARLFVQEHPPRSRILAFYGEGLANFIEAFAPAAAVPYLADVARLEMLRVSAYHAADAMPLTAEAISRLLADVAVLPEARIGLHPSLAVLRSGHAVVSLWAAHQAADAAQALAAVDPEAAETALVLRAGLDVEISRIPDGAAAFIEQMRQGAAFGDAAEQASAADPAFDLAATLGLLMRGGAITTMTIPRSATS
ncbi:MAG: putative DNA-binding domain-containing protein [Sulfuritalea sp.]|nr:putative DNA-binding domain-containing protein [Sulfuritalea sp.]